MLQFVDLIYSHETSRARKAFDEKILWFSYLCLNMAPSEAINGQEQSNVIRFNVTKNEVYKLDDGYKTLMRRQKGYFKIVTNTQNITSDAFTNSKVFVLAGPREKFTENEFDHLKR